jgi:hypothetical protein
MNKEKEIVLWNNIALIISFGWYRYMPFSILDIDIGNISEYAIGIISIRIGRFVFDIYLKLD